MKEEKTETSQPQKRTRKTEALKIRQKCNKVLNDPAASEGRKTEAKRVLKMVDALMNAKRVQQNDERKELPAMSQSEENKFRDELNQSIWNQSSDELHKIKMDRYARGESDGSDLPENIRRQVRSGSLFGKIIAIAVLLGAVYLLFLFGGATASFVRSFF